MGRTKLALAAVAALAAIAIAATLVLLRSREEVAMPLELELPDAAGAWRAAGAPVEYDPESIFDYLDGHAEVYLAYAMERCLAQRYSGPEGRGDLVLDVFLLESAADAFGVFTFDLDGEPVEIGSGALIHQGWLRAWKGRAFVSAYAEDQGADAGEALLELVRRVTERLPDEGELPPILGRLPGRGLVPGSARYMTSHQILNRHLAASLENVLGIDRTTPAVLAQYEGDEGRARVLLVEYPDEAGATRAASALWAQLLGVEASDGPVRLGDGSWAGVAVDGPRLVGVLEASAPERVTSLLREAVSGGGG